MEPDATRPEADDFTPEALDEYLTMNVMMPHGGDLKMAKVIGRKRDSEGNPIRTRHSNPILDSRTMYDVEFPDGSSDSFTANQIAENLFSQIDHKGRVHQIWSDIIDHRKGPTAVLIDKGFITT